MLLRIGLPDLRQRGSQRRKRGEDGVDGPRVVETRCAVDANVQIFDVDEVGAETDSFDLEMIWLELDAFISAPASLKVVVLNLPWIWPSALKRSFPLLQKPRR